MDCLGYLNSLGLYVLLAWARLKNTWGFYQIAAVNRIRQNYDGDLWLWPDGRISLHEPQVYEDRKDCWEYRAHTGTLSWLNATSGRVKRWPWVSLAISFTPDAEPIDYTDVLDNMKFCSGGTRPPARVVASLLSQKIGSFIGDGAVYSVSPKMDPLAKISFSIGLQAEEDKSAWDSAWP